MAKIILIADDHAVQRQGGAAYLKAMFPAIRVIEATNGMEAVAIAKRESPDLVLMDVRMPEMDGIEATKQIKAAVPGTTVVMHTLMDDFKTRREADAAGADAYVVKGVNGTLETTVRGLMGDEHKP